MPGEREQARGGGRQGACTGMDGGGKVQGVRLLGKPGCVLVLQCPRCEGCLFGFLHASPCRQAAHPDVLSTAPLSFVCS